MSKLKKLACILLAGATFFTSCEKDSAPPKNTDNQTSTGTMKATVDGTAWTGTEYGGEIQQGKLKITGKDANGRTITMTATSNGSPGNYLMYIGTGHVATYQSGAGEPIYSTNNSQSAFGAMNITRYDPVNKIMSGDFKILAYDPSGNKSVDITEGIFKDISITPDPMMANSALIDEELWEAQGSNFIFGGGKLVIRSYNSNGSYIVFGLPDNVTTGTYNLSSSGSSNYTATYRTIFGNELKATSGMVSIIEHNSNTRTIRGTYSFIAEDILSGETHTITEGKFAGTY